jgi:uncharacterized protein (TIGR03066 family)
MKSILAAVAAAVVFVGPSVAADKVDAAKLVGMWALTKSADAEAPKDATVEFTKDNKVTITFKANDKEIKLEGTYKVDGDKLTVKLSVPGGKDNEDTDTIKTLTDEKLVLVDKQNKENEFTKKKEK